NTIMKSIRTLFAGKPFDKREAWAKELVATFQRRPPEPLPPIPPAAFGGGQQPGILPVPVPYEPDRVAAAVAAATVMLAAGNDKLADDYFIQAVTAPNSPPDTAIRYADFLAERKRFKEAA